MQFGISFRAQFPPEDDIRVRFAEVVEQARLACSWGYSSFTKGSHFSSHPFQMFAQLPFLARIAAEAPGVKLIAGIVLLPLHNPLEVAEQGATIDVMTGGNFVLGVGLGYREIEYKAFNVPIRSRVQRMLDNLEAIKRLWTEENVYMKASHFELEGATCSPHPLQEPRPPIWVGADSDPGVRRAARIADSLIINPHARIDTLERQMELYKQELEKCGKLFPKELPIRREVFVARTREEAITKSRPHLARKYKAYHDWGQDKALPEGDNNFSVPFEELIEDRFLLGSPDEVAEQIIDFSRRLGTNHVIFNVQQPGMSQKITLESMQLLAEEVFPRVRQEIQ